MQEPNEQLNEEDLAPLLGQHQLTIMQLSKTIRVLRTRIQVLEEQLGLQETDGKTPKQAAKV